MTEERMIPLNWQEIDKLKLRAHWLDNHNVVVERYLANVLRGSWQFSYQKENNFGMREGNSSPLSWRAE
jgi:hypothetical protein